MTSAELLQVEREWADAIIGNDADAIGRFLADDWVVVDADGRTIDRSVFLGAIRSGILTHEAMELKDPSVRIYQDAAVVMGRATSVGKYRGHPFSTHERSMDVFVKQSGQWRCVATQLTAIAEEP